MISDFALKFLEVPFIVYEDTRIPYLPIGKVLSDGRFIVTPPHLREIIPRNITPSRDELTRHLYISKIIQELVLTDTELTLNPALKNYEGTAIGEALVKKIYEAWKLRFNSGEDDNQELVCVLPEIITLLSGEMYYGCQENSVHLSEDGKAVLEKITYRLVCC